MVLAPTITWDVAADGLVPVARSHSELIAGGLAVMLESRLQEEAALLSTLTLCSFAGLAITLVPWLLLGGTVALHHPFDVEAFLNQLSAFDFDAAVVPGPMATQLSDQAHRAGTG